MGELIAFLNTKVNLLTLNGQTVDLPQALDADGGFKVHVQNPITVTGSITIPGTVDVGDRAGRLLGVVYGSQGQQVQQTATNHNLKVELFSGGTAYDARQVNLLTVNGTTQTARDWSADFIKLQNLDAALSTRATEATLADLKTSLEGRLNTLGQEPSATSAPVTLSTEQEALLQSIVNNLGPVGNFSNIVGTISGVGEAVTLALPAGISATGFQLTGAFVGTVTFESSEDGGTTYNARVYRSTGIANNLVTSTSTFPSEWRGNSAAMTHIRVRCTAYTSGTLNVNIRGSSGVGAVFLNAPVRQEGKRLDDTYAEIPLDEHGRDYGNEQTSPITNGAPVTFTVDEPNNKILSAAHGLTAGKVIHVTSTGTLPAPLTTTGNYYVINPTADDFQIATTRLGAAINLTTSGTGTLTYKVAGEFTGAYRRISDVDHTELLYASLNPLAVVERIWSDDGINELPNAAFSRSTLMQRTVNGYNVVYDVTEGRNIAPYYKLHVINGPTDQGAYPSFVCVNWLVKTPYQGVFAFTDDEPSQLTKALVVKQFHQKTSRLTSTPLGAGGTFTTIGLEAVGNLPAPNAQGYYAGTNWADIDLHVWGQPFNAQGILSFYFSHDGVTDHIGPVATTVSDLTASLPIPLRNFAYWRVEYTNGTVPQTQFGIFIVQRASVASDLTRTLAQSISPADPVKVVRAMVEPSPRGERGMLGADKDVFGAGIVANRSNQLSADFSKPLALNRVTQTITGSGAVTGTGNGQVVLSTGASATASAKLETIGRIAYNPGSGVYHMFTARFTAPTSVNSHQRIGLYDDSNGFFIGYNGTTFGLTVRSAGVDTFIPRSSFNGDPLDGSFRSRFFRGEMLEPIDLTKLNVWRIRFGWLGSSVMDLEVQNPEGIWMLVHRLRQPNTATTPHIQNPNLPIRTEVIKSSADATDLVIGSGSWAAGASASPTLSDFAKLLQRVVENTDEMRLDVEPTNTDYFIGIAPDGTTTASAAWNVARIYLSATKNPTRMRFRQSVAWDNRAAGWS